MAQNSAAEEPDAILEVLTQDDHRFQLMCFDSGIEPQQPLFLCWPALGTRAHPYKKLAWSLHGQGYAVVVSELRGHGSSSCRASHSCNYGYREMLQYDWPAAIEALRVRYPQRPLYLLGHSIGGQLSLLYAAAHPNEANGVVIIASCSVYRRAFGAQGLALCVILPLLQLITVLLGYFPGDVLKFAHREGRQVMSDWACQCRTGNYHIKDDPRPYESLLRTMTVPVLALEMQGDFLAPPRAVSHLLDKLSQAPIHREMLETVGSRPGRGAHFHWLKQPEKVSFWIHEWLATDHHSPKTSS